MSAECDVYTTRDALEILADDRPPPEEVWGGLRLAPGQIMEVIGGSGLGKSRMMLNLAVNQVLGRPFAGLETLSRPLTWLFYGNENTFYRFRDDLSKMTSALSDEERERLRGRIWLPTGENSGDAFVSFTDPANREKLKATMRLRKPDVLVLDPWGAFIDGEELNDGDVRRTILEITDILAANPDRLAVAIVLNHSRNGFKEIVEAAGPNSGNYGKNSKAIFSVVRNVWNLRPAHLEEPTTRIELIHAKSSDARPYPPRAVMLDEKTLSYEVYAGFNHDVWQRALEKELRRGSTQSGEQRAAAEDAKQEEDRKKILDFVEENGPVKKSDLDTWTRKNGMGINAAKEHYRALVDGGRLKELVENASSRKHVGTPAQIERLAREAQPGLFRKV